MPTHETKPPPETESFPQEQSVGREPLIMNKLGINSAEDNPSNKLTLSVSVETLIQEIRLLRETIGELRELLGGAPKNREVSISNPPVLPITSLPNEPSNQDIGEETDCIHGEDQLQEKKLKTPLAIRLQEAIFENVGPMRKYRSLNALARAAHVDPGQLSRFAHSTGRLSQNSLERVCQVLELGLSPMPTTETQS